ncbi:unnamed protein product [Closterium sp. NIES-64]|nr:unnamed protein product [Closterium sp. NIES-64]
MDPSRHPTPHTQSDNTTPNSHPPGSTNTTTPATAAPETQESQIRDRTNTLTAPSTTPSVTPSNYWVYQIPSPSASYDADDDYGLGAAFEDNAAPGEVEEEPTAQPTEPSTTTAAASRHSTARNSPRWTAEEECEVLATFIVLDPQIRARTGQQGRSWYPLVQRDILERNPTWRHDQGALKAKFNRLKAEWRRINDRIRRSGEGRVTNLPPWYHLAERLWGERPSTIPPVLAGTGIAPARMATARPAPPAANNTRATPTVATPQSPTSSPSRSSFVQTASLKSSSLSVRSVRSVRIVAMAQPEAKEAEEKKAAEEKAKAEEAAAAAAEKTEEKKEAYTDPLDAFCDDNPAADECRIYED